MSSLKSIIGRRVVTLLYYAFRIFPVKKKKIFVKNFFGKGYGDSPKYIIDYLLKNYSGFDIVWSVNGNYDFPQGIRPIKNNNIRGIVRTVFEQTTSKIWIDNCRKYPFERKRKSQYYIQTWHGDIGIKKVEFDVMEKLSPEKINLFKHDSKMANLFVCGNEWMLTRYKEALGFDGEIAVCGLPRRDILYNNDENLKNEIKKRIGVDSNYKILLYVPTFRANDIINHQLGGYVTQFDWKMTLNALENRFGGKWIGLIRLHPNVSKYSTTLNLPNVVKDVTKYPDISELLFVSDCCISDYSSALFDYAVNKKVGFIFAPDKSEYDDERGYYFSAEDYPFAVATSIDELVANINSFDEKAYLIRHNHFYMNTIKMCPEEHGSEFLANRIVAVCEK